MEGIRRFFGNILFFINFVVALYTLLAYQLVYSANVGHWVGGFISLTVPFLFVVHLVFLLIWLFASSFKALLPLGILLIGFPLVERSYQFRTHEIHIYDSKPFSVLSYNLMYCDVSNYVHEKQRSNALGILATIDTLKADIKCFQELYNSDDLQNFRVIHKLTNRTPFYTYMHSSPSNNEGQGEIGLAIFSKYPIINKQEVYWKKNHNGMLAADILIKHDTIRIINVQLRSMGIRVQKVLRAKADDELVKEETKNIIRQLKDGFEQRSPQVLELEKWIQDSPYPVLVCGDFNEIVYGFAYGRVRKYLTNSFEKLGRGFGFTYNKTPKYIRIDNHFYDDKKVNLLDFQTLSGIPFSDHYPLLGKYQLVK